MSFNNNFPRSYLNFLVALFVETFLYTGLRRKSHGSNRLSFGDSVMFTILLLV